MSVVLCPPLPPSTYPHRLPFCCCLVFVRGDKKNSIPFLSLSLFSNSITSLLSPLPTQNRFFTNIDIIEQKNQFENQSITNLRKMN